MSLLDLISLKTEKAHDWVIIFDFFYFFYKSDPTNYDLKPSIQLSNELIKFDRVKLNSY